jgi:cyclophilin family peptidyl-prolyl cis-trans isomerase
MELELYDEDKPLTVSNFIKYVTSGRFQNQFIQRWEPNFVIQAGGYYVGTGTNNETDFRTVPEFGTITNEYKVGRTFTNQYGTIAMARIGGQTNSATSQWFLNLTNNVFLDNVDGGFTVFGHVTSGTNVLNLFVPSPPAGTLQRVNIQGYYNDYHEPIVLDTLPVTNKVTAFNQVFTNLIYVNFSLRRDLGIQIKPITAGQHQITWNSVSGVTNIVEYRDAPGTGNWTLLSQVVGTGAAMAASDTSSNPERVFRVKLIY